MPEPLTREEALAQGFKPIPEIDILAAGHGISVREFEKHKADYAAKHRIHCTNQTVKQVCLDWTDDNGVRTICYCTLAQTCNDCVQK